MIEKSIEKFKSEGFLIVDLQCAPPTSEPIWRHLGFMDYLTTDFESNQKMYKTLVSTLELLIKTDNSKMPIIELWKGVPNQTMNLESTWKWKVSFINDSDKLFLNNSWKNT